MALKIAGIKGIPFIHKKENINNIKEESTMKEKVNLQAPWIEYHKKVFNLFEADPEVNVYDVIDTEEGVKSFDIGVTNLTKLEALDKILKKEVVFGNVTLKINFIHDEIENRTVRDNFREAFNGNPYFKKISSMDLPGQEAAVNFAVFSRDVISYFIDDLTDYCGNKHVLPAEIAKEVTNWEGSNVRICTLAPEE